MLANLDFMSIPQGGYIMTNKKSIIRLCLVALACSIFCTGCSGRLPDEIGFINPYRWFNHTTDVVDGRKFRIDPYTGSVVYEDDLYEKNNLVAKTKHKASIASVKVVELDEYESSNNSPIVALLENSSDEYSVRSKGVSGEIIKPVETKKVSVPSDLDKWANASIESLADETILETKVSFNEPVYTHKTSGNKNGRVATGIVSAPISDISFSQEIIDTAMADLETVLHTVAPGDTLFRLARRYYGDGSRWREIRCEDGTLPRRIYVGQTLQIPALASASVSGLPLALAQ